MDLTGEPHELPRECPMCHAVCEKVGIPDANHQCLLAVEVLTRIQHQGRQFLCHIQTVIRNSSRDSTRHLEQYVVLFVDFLITKTMLSSQFRECHAWKNTKQRSVMAVRELS